MKITHKLMLSIAIAPVMIWVVCSCLARAGEQSLREAIEQNSITQARAVMDELDRIMHMRIAEWQAYAREPAVRRALKHSNDEFVRLDDPQAFIDGRDAAWGDVPPDSLSPLMNEFMHTELARGLRAQMMQFTDEQGNPAFAEVIVTNRFGANVGQTNRTSDYRQDDEEWWQLARRDRLHVSDVGFDESAGVYSTEVAIRVDNEQGGFLGVIKVLLNIEEVVETLDVRAAGAADDDPIEFTLFTADRRIIRSTGRRVTPLTDGSHIFDESGIGVRRLDTHRTVLSHRDETSRSAPQDEAGTATALTVVMNGDGHPDDSMVCTFVVSGGYGEFTGLGWILLLERSAANMFGPIGNLKRDLLLMSIAATLAALLLGGLIAIPMSRRVKRLSKAAAAIGRGAQEVTVRVDGHDELARLAQSFNQMSAELNVAQDKAETRAQILNIKNAQLFREVEERRQIEKQVEILSRFPLENPNPVMRIEEDGTIAYANDASDPLLAEWGVSVGESLPDQWVQMFQEVLDSGTAIEAELECGDQTFLCSMSSVAGSRYGYLYARDITERKRAEEALRLTQFAVDHSSDAVYWIRADGRISYANHSACERLGYSYAELVSMSVPEIDPDFPQEDWPGHWDEMKRAGAMTFEAHHLTKNGEVFPVEITTNHLMYRGDEYIWAYARDITERKRAEMALQASESRTRAIIECAPDCIISIDHESRILEFNPAAERTFGYTRTDALGADLTELIIPPALREKHRAGMDHYLRTGEGPVLGKLIEITAMRADGNEFPVEMAITAVEREGNPMFIAIIRDITERKEAEEQHLRLAAAIEAATEMIVITDTEAVIQYVNPAFERVTGYAREEVIGARPSLWKSGKQAKAFYENLWRTISAGNVWSGSFINKRKDGTLFHEESTISPVRNKSGRIVNFVAVKRDVSRERHMEVQLRHAQKMESIGQLAAGIAHEINTPTQYVGDNTRFVRDSVNDLLKLIDHYGTLLASARDGGVNREQIAQLESAVQALDLDFIKEEIPKAIEQTLDGVKRIAEIVRAMKDFSHPGNEEKTPTDLNAAIQSTIIVCRNRWKYVADLETDFDPDLPSVPCLVGEFNQVVLNIIVNAADAIGDVVGDGGETRGKIAVSTRLDGEFVEIRISDTGGGIPEAIRTRIFDPFFTTKEVGKGTGQGLAICHDVIVTKHGGMIDLEVEPGVGTTFIIRLPWAEHTAEMQKGAA